MVVVVTVVVVVMIMKRMVISICKQKFIVCKVISCSFLLDPYKVSKLPDSVVIISSTASPVLGENVITFAMFPREGAHAVTNVQFNDCKMERG